jgi:signal transduction histidine kinase
VLATFLDSSLNPFSVAAVRILQVGLLVGFSTSLCLRAQDIVEVDRHSSIIPLHEHMELLRDAVGQWRIEDIRSESVSSAFSKSDVGNDALGFSRDAIWLRVELRSLDPERTEWFVELANSRIEWAEWYVVQDGEITTTVTSGIHRETMPQLIRSRFPTLPLVIDAGKTVELFLKIRSESRIRLPLILYSATSYYERDRHAELIYLCGFGAILTLISAGLIFGLAVDFRGSLYYSASILACGLYFFGLSGYWAMLEFPGWQFGSRQGSLCLGHFFLLGLLLYLDSFFDLKNRIPGLSRLTRRIALAGAVTLFVIPFLPYWPTIVFVEAEVACFGVFAMYTAIVCARRGMGIAIYYLIAWSSFWAVALLVAFHWWRHTPALPDPLPLLFATVNLALITFLLSMGDRARRQRLEMEIAQKKVFDLQFESNERLERQVEARTMSLNEAKEQAERANHYKEMFLANISHEIRTPLSALISLSQAMHSQSQLCQLPPSFIRMLEQIRSGGKYLNLMLTNLLDASSANVGKKTLRLESFKLDQWSELCRDILEPIANAKGLTLKWHNEALSDQVLVSDQVRLSQILINLVHNAVKFTDEGTVEVNFFVEGNTFSFEVRDDGPGLPLPVEALYEAFEQSLPVEADPTHGVGLGLYVVQSNVRLLKGGITGTAGPTGGTVFLVEFTNALQAA